MECVMILCSFFVLTLSDAQGIVGGRGRFSAVPNYPLTCSEFPAITSSVKATATVSLVSQDSHTKPQARLNRPKRICLSSRGQALRATVPLRDTNGSFSWVSPKIFFCVSVCSFFPGRSTSVSFLLSINVFPKSAPGVWLSLHSHMTEYLYQTFF